MSNAFCVNKSGVTIPVYSDRNGSTQIGTIANREAFGYNANWGGDGAINLIRFKSAAGPLRDGYILNPPNGAMTECTDYPYGTVVINGETFFTFIMRRTSTVYRTDGTSWGSVAANRRVACRTAMAGDSYPEWKGINYVESTSGAWVQVTSYGNDKYGFVDTGLEIASGASNIPMYGSW